MSLRFVMLKGTTVAHDKRSLLALERTHPSALGTGLLLAQLTGLLVGGHLQGAGQQTLHGRHRDILHLGEIDIETGPLFAPVLAHDNFSPAFGQFADVFEILRRQFTSRHCRLLQRDKSISLDEILPKVRL